MPYNFYIEYKCIDNSKYLKNLKIDEIVKTMTTLSGLERRYFTLLKNGVISIEKIILVEKMIL